MPDLAYQASISISDVPGIAKPGAPLTVRVEMTNRSSVDWLQREYGALSAGNHWLDATGRMVTRDDGRARLPAAVPAGETCRVALTVSVPSTPGDYLLEIDIAHEGVLWFHDRGSNVSRAAIRVANDAENVAASS
jgi:hypothetical protein